MNIAAFGDVTTQSGGAAPVSTFDKVLNSINKVVTVAQPVANVVSTIKSGQQQSSQQPASTNPWVTQADPGGSAAPPAATPDNTMKYVLIGGVGLLAIAGVVVAVKSSKKKK